MAGRSVEVDGEEVEAQQKIQVLWQWGCLKNDIACVKKPLKPIVFRFFNGLFSGFGRLFFLLLALMGVHCFAVVLLF